MACVGFFIAGHFFRSSFRNNTASAISRFRTEIDHIVCIGDDVEIMFDDDESVLFIG